MTGAADEGSAACAQLALLAIEAGAWEEAAAHAAQGMRLVEGARLDDYLACALAIAVAARVAVQQGDTTRASECIAKVHRLRPLLNPGLSWLSVQTGLELKGVHLALGSRRSPPRSGARPRRSCACALALACWPTRGASCAPA